MRKGREKETWDGRREKRGGRREERGGTEREKGWEKGKWTSRQRPRNVTGLDCFEFTIVLCPLYCKPGFVRDWRNEKREGEGNMGWEKWEKGWEKGGEGWDKRRIGLGEGRKDTLPVHPLPIPPPPPVRATMRRACDTNRFCDYMVQIIQLQKKALSVYSGAKSFGVNYN